tara:strand:- start:416 stop:1567 length:1152 start_codon:yes stop_codon:yes gene_type:complete
MAINIKKLSNIIKQNLPVENIKLSAEVRQPKISNGHMYLNLKDDYGCISSIIWKSNINDNIKNFKDGDKIVVLGNLNYYVVRGSISFIISKLINKEGLGELHKKYEKIKKMFEDKGYFYKENKLLIPKIIKNILILTSKNGAALHDFYYGLENGNSKVNHTLIDVIVQGNDCPSNLINILSSKDIKNNVNNYDLIVITRGGGSFEDLFGFCQPELIECIHNLKTPVLSAIGHQVDTTLIDFVADAVAPTPSLAAQFIVDNNKKYIDELLYKKHLINQKLISNILRKIQKIKQFKIIVNNQREIFNNYKIKMYNKLNDNYHKRLIYLEKMKNKFKLDDKITLFSEKVKITNCNLLINNLVNNSPFTILWNNKLITFKNYEYEIN